MNPPLPAKKRLTPQDEYRAALRTDVVTVVKRAGSYDDKTTPALTPLVQELVKDHTQLGDKFDVLKLAISKLGGDQQSALATILLGIKETRASSKKERYEACAKVTHHKDGESFRNSVVAGVKRIDIILDEVTGALFVMASQHGLVPQAPIEDKLPTLYVGTPVGVEPLPADHQAFLTEVVTRLERNRQSREFLDNDLLDIPEPN